MGLRHASAVRSNQLNLVKMLLNDTSVNTLADRREASVDDSRRQDFVHKWEMLVAESWADVNLKSRLLENPIAALKERGIDPPANLEVRIVEDTRDVIHLVFPSQPSERELSEFVHWPEQFAAIGTSGCPGIVRTLKSDAE